MSTNVKIVKGNRVRHVRFAGLRGVVVDVVERGAKLMVVVDHETGGRDEYEPAWLLPVGRAAVEGVA